MQTLNELMSFGHVVHSDGRGNVTDSDRDVLANELVYAIDDGNGGLVQLPDKSDAVIEDLYAGWTLLRGFTGQDRYNGAIMHQSEYIGGGLERYIRENAGYYVAVSVDVLPLDRDSDDAESTTAGWAVAYRATI